jgi:integrase
VKVSAVIALYAEEVAPKAARPKEVGARLAKVGEFFGDMTLAEITGRKCREYAARRGNKVCRRELEDLRSAIRYHWREGFCTVETKIVLPQKSPPRQRWLTRSEAARLLWAAWRREGRHVARFILVGLYTGSRAGVIASASFRPMAGRAYVDTAAGVLHRRPGGERDTKKRRPPAPLSDRLLCHLERWKRNEAAYVVSWRGRPVASARKAFQRSAVAAGLGPDVTPHTLRHTAATWGMQAGADPWKLAGLLGMTVQTLIDNYGHWHSAIGREAAENIASRPTTSHTISVNKRAHKANSED